MSSSSVWRRGLTRRTMNEQEALPGVLLYYHLYPTVFAKVSADECQLLVQAIFSTGGVCEMPELDKNLDIVWGLIKRMLDNNQASYQQKLEQSSAAGKKGVQKREENREKHRQEIIERSQAEEKALDDQAQQGSLNALNDNGDYQQAQQAQQAKSKSNDKSKSTSKSNDKITNAQSADADEGSLSAACSADAEPERKKSSAKKQSVSKKIEEHFRELWMLYPLKRGKNHVKAAAKRRLADVSAAEMARAIDRYEREYENAPPDRQMLYGSTWFNGRWEDYSDDNYSPPPEKPAQKSARAQQAQFRSAEEESKQADYWAGREE